MYTVPRLFYTIWHYQRTICCKNNEDLLQIASVTERCSTGFVLLDHCVQYVLQQNYIAANICNTWECLYCVIAHMSLSLWNSSFLFWNLHKQLCMTLKNLWFFQRDCFYFYDRIDVRLTLKLKYINFTLHNYLTNV